MADTDNKTDIHPWAYQSYLPTLKERISKLGNGEWHFSWRDLFWIVWGFIWRLFTTSTIAISGFFLFMLISDRLAVIDAQVYDTWQWGLYVFVHFSTLIGIILSIWLSWYKEE